MSASSRTQSNRFYDDITSDLVANLEPTKAKLVVIIRAYLTSILQATYPLHLAKRVMKYSDAEARNVLNQLNENDSDHDLTTKFEDILTKKQILLLHNACLLFADKTDKETQAKIEKNPNGNDLTVVIVIHCKDSFYKLINDMIDEIAGNDFPPLTPIADQMRDNLTNGIAKLVEPLKRRKIDSTSEEKVNYESIVNNLTNEFADGIILRIPNILIVITGQDPSLFMTLTENGTHTAKINELLHKMVAKMSAEELQELNELVADKLAFINKFAEMGGIEKIKKVARDFLKATLPRVTDASIEYEVARLETHMKKFLGKSQNEVDKQVMDNLNFIMRN